MRLLQLNELVDRWIRVLSPPEFTLLTYLYRAASPDGLVSRPRQEIAETTKILPRKIRPMLKSLAERGVIEVIRLAEERTVVRILPQHRSFRPAVSPGKPVDRVAAIKQLVLRMTGQRPGLEDVRRMELESGTNEQGLLDTLQVLDAWGLYRIT